VTSPSPLLLGDTLNPGALYTLARRQAADLDFIARAVRKRVNIAAGRIAVVAHSFGARAAFVALAEGLHAFALVSLDGGIANAAGRDWLDQAPPNSASASAVMSVPLLHFYQTDDSTVVPDFKLIQTRWRGDRYLARITHMYHPYLTSLGFVCSAVPGVRVAPAVPDLNLKAAAIANLTVAFLRAAADHHRYEPGPLPSFLALTRVGSP
jgi:dienelactone hydrolase